MVKAQQLGPYHMVRRLGQGGMAEVFLAVLKRRAGFHKKVVIKRILPPWGDDPSFVRLFIDEAVLTAQLTHPNIVQVYDFGLIEGVYFIAMEYVDGADVRQILQGARARGQRLSPDDVAFLGQSAACGLHHAHTAVSVQGAPLGIVHRDVSPANLLISRTGELKITDFGIARAAHRAPMTTPGILRGKLAYMAPEQAAGKPADSRCDQYALGLVLWECLAGSPCFGAVHQADLLRQVMAARVLPLDQVCPGVPEDLSQIVMRSLAYDPNARYPDLGAMAHALGLWGLKARLRTQTPVQLHRWVDVLTRSDANGSGAGFKSRATLALSQSAPAALRWKPLKRWVGRGVWVGAWLGGGALGMHALKKWHGVLPPTFQKPALLSLESPKETGCLSLRVVGPWVEVYWKDTLLGSTPLHQVTLPAGDVTLRLRNGEAGIDQSITLSIPAHQELKYTVELSWLSLH